MLAMRLLISALVITFLVAVTASVFAIWPVVADAPWEDSQVTEDGKEAIQCEAALSLRETIIAEGEFNIRVNPGGVQDYDRQLDMAKAEIARYC